ncbi:ABC transporter substrate-binding protein [Rhodoluna sp.]|uniref:ABC transporter substrate-binding protein n=1 Tax=Rhodoluna sp. TaxID=1969481 RepID=UPI0025E26D8A|nr:ABC transporter substrate-binding protein [Rhodoluna sp.]
MKATRIVRAVAGVAVSGLTIAGLSLAAVAPANSAARSTVVMMETSAMTSLNSGTPDTNLVTNSDVGYLTGMGFIYYDNKPNLLRNTKFGHFEVVKKTPTDFQVKYTVNKGQIWSDGTPVTAVDLLLSHVLSSGKYSIAAGLGDPSGGKPAFDSVGYGGSYDGHVVGNPVLSSDNMSLTIKYDSFQPEWELLGPGPSPVHALEQLADGKKAAGTAAANLASKAQFLKDFTSKNTTRLKKMGAIWSESYNIKTVDSSTNPLLLVSNGAFKVQSAVADQSVTMVRNAKYSSGPAMAKTNPINKIIFSFIADGSPSYQALRNGDIDIYDGQPDAAGVAQLKAIRSATVYGGVSMTYEHVDLRVGAVPGATTAYTGPFAGNSQKAQDLREAFLLALPRDGILESQVKPFSPNGVVMNSHFTLPGQTGYSTIVKSSGVSSFTTGTQADRTARALALVKKYYPTASATNSVVDINFLFKGSQRRIDENKLIAAEAAKAGFKVSTTPNSAWSTKLDDVSYDAAMFAWAPSSTSQTGTNANFLTDGGNNHSGWGTAELDKILHSLEAYLTPAQITAKYLAAETIINANNWTLPLYQWPTTIAANTALKGIKSAPLTPNVVWNFWEWHY